MASPTVHTYVTLHGEIRRLAYATLRRCGMKGEVYERSGRDLWYLFVQKLSKMGRDEDRCQTRQSRICKICEEKGNDPPSS